MNISWTKISLVDKYPQYICLASVYNTKVANFRAQNQDLVTGLIAML